MEFWKWKWRGGSLPAASAVAVSMRTCGDLEFSSCVPASSHQLCADWEACAWWLSGVKYSRAFWNSSVQVTASGFLTILPLVKGAAPWQASSTVVIRASPRAHVFTLLTVVEVSSPLHRKVPVPCSCDHAGGGSSGGSGAVGMVTISQTLALWIFPKWKNSKSGDNSHL